MSKVWVTGRKILGFVAVKILRSDEICQRKMT